MAAYNGQATNLSRATLEAAAKVVSVEARHAAWIRSIIGEPPAPDATDTPLSADEVLEGLQQIGLEQADDFCLERLDRDGALAETAQRAGGISRAGFLAAGLGA